ncbi:MAG TPA: hypothetical protein VM121_09685 [Acidimicrobiales bacterium]|nr:hypothetical protein [Acidimicrobiales bacterium]
MRRKAKAAAAATATQAANADPNGSQPAEPEPTMVDQPVEPTAQTEAAAPPPPPPAADAAPVPTGPRPDYSTTGDGGDPRDFTVKRYLDLGDLFTSPRNMSEEERQRMAAADFQAAISPAFRTREDGPPSAATPDDAVRQFVEATGEALPDPGAGNQGNIFGNEATAYMRLRKQFSKNIGRAGGSWTAPPGLMPGAPADGGQHRVFYPRGS